MNRRIALVVLAIAIPVAVDQVILFSALRDDELFGRRIAPFDPALFNAAQAESLVRFESWVRGEGALAGPFEHDAELGWAPRPNGGTGEFRYDAVGARIAGDAPDSAGSTASPASSTLFLFGDSFTHGDEVAARESWPAQLGASRPSVMVKNFGVSGYGIDQALLRCRRALAAEKADEVWLGFVPEAGLRVLSVYGPALRHDDGSISFKPRFELSADGDLVAVANPAADPARALALLGSARTFEDEIVAHEFFAKRWPDAYRARRSSPWHWFAFSRVLLTRLEGGDRAPETWLADPASEASRLSVRLLVAFDREVKSHGGRCRVIVLPDGRSLRRRAANGGVGYWEPLCREAAAEGVEIIDLSATLLGAGVGVEPQTAEYWAPLGHYAARTNAIVASKLGELLPSR